MTQRQYRARATKIVSAELHPLMPRSRRLMAQYVEETIKDLKELDAETQVQRTKLVGRAFIAAGVVAGTWASLSILL